MEKNTNKKKQSAAIQQEKKSGTEKNKAARSKNNSGDAVVVPASFPEKIKYYGKKSAVVFNRYKKPVGTALTYIIPAAIFLYVVSVVIYFITSAYRTEFHSDCTDTILWANASIEGGAVYDKNFGYACFLPFGINVIMQPLINMFGLTMKAHIWGMMSYFILLVLFFCLMLKEMHWNIRSIFIACSVFLSMTVSSQKLREIFWQHTIYYTLGILFIVIGLYLYFHMLNLTEKLKSLNPKDIKGKITFLRFMIVFVCLAVFIMFTATDGISALSIFAIPFIAALFAEFFVNPENNIASKKAFRTIATVGCFGIMIILGMKLNAKWTGDLKAGYQDAYSVFSPIGDWTNNMHNFPLAWMKLNGVQDVVYQTKKDGTAIRISDMEGIQNLLYIIASLILLVMPIIATCFYPKFKKAKDGHMMRLFVWMHWACTAIVLMGYFFGVLSGADWRLTPIIGTSLILSIFFVHWAISTKTSAQRIIVLLSIPVIMVSLLNLRAVKDIEKDYHKANNLYGIADFLEDEGLTYGYSSFWQANAITLITDSKVKVRDVNIDDYGVTARIYQSSKEWYKDQPDQKEYFLLLNPYEYQTLQNINSPLLTETVRELSTLINNTEYRVLVFDHNFIPEVV